MYNLQINYNDFMYTNRTIYVQCIIMISCTITMMYSCIPKYLSSSVQNGVSPVSPLFQPLQACLAHLQFPRKNISYKELIGEGAFGEVYLGEITGLVRAGKTINLVAVKQLRCKDINCVLQ